MCWFTKDENRKRNLILPMAFLAITVFFAIRYDYGLDYWGYFNYYESGRTVEGDNRGTGEALFYSFMNFFPKYTYFIIAHTIIVFSILYIVTRKYLLPKQYPLFFFLILTMSVLSFNWISALRSTMAAAILWIGLDLFYIKKKRWVPFVGIVILAGFFHTSALFLLLLPFLDFIIEKSNPLLLFIILIVGLISSLFFTNDLYRILLSSNRLFLDAYADYLNKESTEGYSIFGVIHNSILLFPYYYVVAKKNLFKGEYQRIFVLATIIIVLRCFKIDFNGRFSAYLFIFVIYAWSYVLQRLNKKDKIICLLPLLVWCFYGIYLFYMQMFNGQFTVYSSGNYLFYHTIFEASPIP